ncbi:MAG: hypothetical protein Q7J09_10495 [Methanocalculus sp.]|uniref:hypothetical protein n=1 Tax=Methanocalculus sp. TaxID=2004547 RepID=UPI002724D03B|nr:hypothetical protein [Methanocalculus sp.]MDO9540413.1 hypothetical protein [Methanocalculus sp.]
MSRPDSIESRIQSLEQQMNITDLPDRVRSLEEGFHPFKAGNVLRRLDQIEERVANLEIKMRAYEDLL